MNQNMTIFTEKNAFDYKKIPVILYWGGATKPIFSEHYVE